MKPISVSELTQDLKTLLEENFCAVWVEGELSNYTQHSSGHHYFSLKDSGAVISACMFRGSNRLLKFKPKEGMSVVCYGRVSVYPPRGNYQLIIERMEPQGLGALQMAFEQLKEKLKSEGLFDAERKKPLPQVPRKVGIVTSPTGAAIRDMIHVSTRRFPSIEILIHPTLVQGETAATEIAAAIEIMDQQGLDVIIVGRGGGSIEDLWAFNEEIVARALANAQTPIISAVGHETDFTIADFVADVRAPTPSAAAELAVPVIADLLFTIQQWQHRLESTLQIRLETIEERLKTLKQRLKDPEQNLNERGQRIDELRERLNHAMRFAVDRSSFEWARLQKTLESLSPLNILQRGYAVVQSPTNPAPLISTTDLANQQELKITLSQGSFLGEVKKILS